MLLTLREESGLLKIISDSAKFKPIKEDPTLLREGQLQRFLRKLKTKGHLDPNVYSKIFPSGSQPARIYGLPKMHKPRGCGCPHPLEKPPFSFPEPTICSASGGIVRLWYQPLPDVVNFTTSASACLIH